MNRKLFFLLLLIPFFSPLFSQDSKKVDTYIEQFLIDKAKHPTELIYIQTSKGIYETCEDLWFKAYQFDAQNFGLSGLSKTLYLQMLSESSDSVVWQEKYPVNNGIATGHVYIPENLPDGNYFLEAYTRHSFYEDSLEMASVRKVRIQKDAMHIEKTQSIRDTIVRFTAYPEGGNLVSGITSKLAFKATDGYGFPVDVKGVLYEGDEQLLEFESLHAGMGTFIFTPYKDRNYRIKLHNGEYYALPVIHQQGMAIQLVRRTPEFLEFIVSQSEGLPVQSVYLMGQVRGQVCCMASGRLSKSLRIQIPLKAFPMQGIAEFTLLNNDMQPVAERLVYVNPDKKLRINIEPDKKRYETREKASLKIKVTDDDGKPVVTHLGISVFDQMYANPADPVNILSHCYMSSQIRGKIYNPAYYFDESNEDRVAALDLLMLTQGWRRYIWEAVTPQGHGTRWLTDEITGVQSIRNKKFKNTEQLIQVSSAGSGEPHFVWADSLGNFTIDYNLIKALQGGYLYLKPMVSVKSGLKLTIDDPFPQLNAARAIKKFYYPYTNPDNESREDAIHLPIVGSDSVLMLDGAVVTAKSKRPLRDKYLGHLDSLMQLDFGPWVCEHGHLENYKPGYTVHHDPRYCPCPNAPKERNPPVIGKTYRIIKPKYHERSDKSGCWFTVEAEEYVVYQGPLYTDEELLRMNNIWRTKGFYGAREFYQPDELEIQSPLPDVRNTLLWAPSVITDENGEASVSFY
mgnify:CR=1 FL=1